MSWDALHNSALSNNPGVWDNGDQPEATTSKDGRRKTSDRHTAEETREEENYFQLSSTKWPSADPHVRIEFTKSNLFVKKKAWVKSLQVKE